MYLHEDACIFMYACLRAYMHACMQTCMHAYMLHKFILMHMYACPCMHKWKYAYTHKLRQLRGAKKRTPCTHGGTNFNGF